ncbi:hypothetical protein GCM10022285_26930 [Streptomyces tunisiensis]|uniref:Uncharacterized protein n=1 Tax=Streptomyces tunisiensis TaxID=948699 RepID=A0ABP7YCZ5_9ACTN
MALPSNGRETAVAKPCARPGSRFPGPPAQAIRCGGLSDSDHAIASAAEDIPGRTAVRERLRLPRRGHGTAVGHRGGPAVLSWLGWCAEYGYDGQAVPDAGTARLLRGRTRGPVFVTHRRPGPGKVVGPRDVCPGPGLARLSYSRPAPCWTSTPPCARAGDRLGPARVPPFRPVASG